MNSLLLQVKTNIQRLRSHIKTPFFNNAYSLIGLQVSTTFLGFLFLLVAARMLSSSQVGIGTALISAVMLILSFAGMGLDDGITYYLPVREDKSSLVNAYFSLSAISSIFFTLVFVLLQPVLTPPLNFVRNSSLVLILFSLSAFVLHLSAMQDSLFIAQRVSKYTLAKGLLVNLMRIPVAMALFWANEWSLLLSLVAVNLVALIVFGAIYVRKVDPSHRYSLNLRPKIWLPILGFSFGNSLTDIIVSFPTTLIPLIILNVLGAEGNAYFYVAWTITSIFNVIGRSFGLSLFVEGRVIPNSINKNVFRSLTASLALLLPAVLLLIILATPILNLFGHEYSIESAVSVRILACSGIPMTIYGIAVGMLKAKGKVIALIINGLAFAILHVAGSWWGANIAGVTGVSWAILAARTISTFIAVSLVFQKGRNGR